MDENGVRTSVHSNPIWNEEMVHIRAAACTINNLQTMKIYVAVHRLDMKGLVTYMNMNMINKQTHIAHDVPVSLSVWISLQWVVGGCRETHTRPHIMRRIAIAVWFVNEDGDEHHLHIRWVIWLRAWYKSKRPHFRRFWSTAAVRMNTDNAKTVDAHNSRTTANSNGGNDMRKKRGEMRPHTPFV